MMITFKLQYDMEKIKPYRLYQILTLKYQNIDNRIIVQGLKYSQCTKSAMHFLFILYKLFLLIKGCMYKKELKKIVQEHQRLFRNQNLCKIFM